MPTVLIKTSDGSSKQFEVDGQKSLFDELQLQGYSLPHGCLSGSCSACKVQVLQGQENLSKPDPIEENTLDSLSKAAFDFPLRLSCRAKLLSSQVTIRVS